MSEILMNYNNGHNSSNTQLLFLTVVFFRNVIFMVCERVLYFIPRINLFNTLWTGDADLCLYITTVQDG